MAGYFYLTVKWTLLGKCYAVDRGLVAGDLDPRGAFQVADLCPETAACGVALVVAL